MGDLVVDPVEGREVIGWDRSRRQQDRRMTRGGHQLDLGTCSQILHVAPEVCATGCEHWKRPVGHCHRNAPSRWA